MSLQLGSMTTRRLLAELRLAAKLNRLQVSSLTIDRHAEFSDIAGTIYTLPCKGIVAYSQEDWRWEHMLTHEPGEDELLVEMIATGVCHTDIIGFGGIYPRVLGHEGAGRILRVGSKQLESRFKQGDLVILSAASCQDCHYCNTKHPAYCVSHSAFTSKANEPSFVLASDHSTVLGGSYFGQSSFASPAPVKASGAVNVTDLVKDSEELKLYAPLGCGIMTGAGAITNVGHCQPDDVVAVIGLGGVGLAGLIAAKHVGVRNIIAVDLVPSRLELAKELGATVSLQSSQEVLGTKSLADAIKELTPGHLGATFILDSTSSTAVLAGAMDALQNNGTLLLVGVKPVGAKLEIDIAAHMVHGRRLVGVIEGDRDPIEALPELLQWCKDDVLPVGKLFKEYKVEDFVQARQQMEKGKDIKAVLVW